MKMPISGKRVVGAFLLAASLGPVRVRPAMGQDGGPAAPTPPRRETRVGLLHKRTVARQGTSGGGKAGPSQGFLGFGLGFHRGYGYGGAALGAGPDGGYPHYGGPGYPHPAPTLRRIGGINPFCYQGGSSPGCPNFFEAVGPLVPDIPVVVIPPDSPYAGEYGLFTGILPYPESAFARFATQAADDSSQGTIAFPPSPRSQPPATPPPSSTAEAVPGSPDARSLLGVDTEAVVDAGSARGLKVTRLQPGSVGDKAGLKVGDVIRSANAFLTEQPGHLSWVADNATPGGLINLTVLRAIDGEVRTITIRRP